MTKDEASDLGSLIKRVVQTNLARYQAELSQQEAQRQLDVFLHKVAQPKKDA